MDRKLSRIKVKNRISVDKLFAQCIVAAHIIDLFARILGKIRYMCKHLTAAQCQIAAADIQIEFGDLGNILAYLSIGDRLQEVERLVSALAEIRRLYEKEKTGLMSQEYIEPQVVASPQDAFYAEKISLPLRESVGCVCSEFVMCYPPGIPILAPGERITKDILDYIEYAKAKGCSMTGPEDPEIEHLNVLR